MSDEARSDRDSVADGLLISGFESPGGTHGAWFSEHYRSPASWRVMTRGSWPFIAGQCPVCIYFQAQEPPFVDDSGYEIVGVCRHPRIAMELFMLQTRTTSEAERCPLFFARPEQ